MSIPESILDFLLPASCIVCGGILNPNEKSICLDCLSDLPRTFYSSRSHNPMADRFNSLIQRNSDGYEPYSYATALFHYRPDSPYSAITKNLKYKRDFPAGRFFSSLLASEIASSPMFRDVDLVIPVPLHWTRYRARGYNQAAVIAKTIASFLGARIDRRILRRSRRTATQTRLGTEEKALNVRGAFRLVRSGHCQSVLSAARHILLVDDVFTTGATLDACRQALRESFPADRRISVATLGFVG